MEVDLDPHRHVKGYPEGSLTQSRGGRGMKRILAWPVLFCAAMFMFAACSSSSEERGQAKAKELTGDYILLDKQVFNVRKAGPVKFTHDAHFDDYGLECTECHHRFSDGKNVWTEEDEAEACEKCHDPVQGRGKLYRLQDAFHKSCKGCHLEVNGGDVDGDAPFKCSGCHEPRKI
jgi:hypothetical protein